jgi:hypothetical protein
LGQQANRNAIRVYPRIARALRVVLVRESLTKKRLSLEESEKVSTDIFVLYDVGIQPVGGKAAVLISLHSRYCFIGYQT